MFDIIQEEQSNGFRIWPGTLALSPSEAPMGESKSSHGLATATHNTNVVLVLWTMRLDGDLP